MKKVFNTLSIAFLIVAFLSTGCAEHRYYHRYHYHTARWYHRHHTPPPAGVNIEIRR